MSLTKKSLTKNANLQSAKKEKNDEFYTRFADIESECAHYKPHFQGKTVLCNCDDPRVSNFFRYFFLNFHNLGLNRLIATCFKNLKPDSSSQNQDERAGYCIYEGTVNEWGTFKGDGDFRSEECIEFLKQADIVCTNPPFSLFREYVAQLMEYEKQFLIIGNYNAISYKEIFPLIKDNRMWLGNGFHGGNAYFGIPDDYSNSQIFFIDGERLCKFRSCCWFTNLDSAKRHRHLPLSVRYTPEKFPKYDHYDAIEVAKMAEIPMDYEGIMGVPITFLNKYNPEQFEILGLDDHRLIYPQWRGRGPDLKGKPVYRRVIIRKKTT